MSDWTRVQTDADFEAYARLRNAMFPDQPTSGPLMRASEERTPAAARMERYLLHQGGQLLGAGVAMHAYWFDAPELFVADAFVFGDDAETFHAIHARVEARILEMGATRTRTMVSSLVPGCLRVLVDKGYREAERFPVTSLRLDAFDPTPFEAHCRAVEASNLVIQPVSRFLEAYPDDWQRRIWQFDMDVSKDMPFEETWSEIPYETYRGQYIDVPTFDPSLHFVAMDGDTIAGITMLILVPGDPKLLGTGLTGAARAYRRRGIATALKVRAIAEARARGFERIVTENEASNPMLALNFQLGYRTVYDEVVATKTLVG